MAWFAHLRDAFKSQWLPVPTIAVVGALLAGIGLPRDGLCS